MVAPFRFGGMTLAVLWFSPRCPSLAGGIERSPRDLVCSPDSITLKDVNVLVDLFLVSFAWLIIGIQAETLLRRTRSFSPKTDHLILTLDIT